LISIVFFVLPILGQSENEKPEIYSAVATATGGAVGG
jgi:hypothetical protein